MSQHKSRGQQIYELHGLVERKFGDRRLEGYVLRRLRAAPGRFDETLKEAQD